MLDTKKILQQTVSRLLDTRSDMSRLDLSRLMDVSDGALGRIKYGHGNPTTETLERIARFFKVEPWQLLVPGFDPANAPKLADANILAAEGEPREGYIRLDLLDVFVSAGPGAVTPQHQEVVQQIDVLAAWARQALGSADPSRIKIVICKGDSMSPTIQSGDIIFVDTHQREFAGDGVYILEWQGFTLVKRLRLLADGRLAIQSDNAAAYEPEYLAGAMLNQLSISGQVVGWWSFKRF